MTSDIELLPHQQQALNEFLSRAPLRYLLADDFGTGKTITACLYLKKLIESGRCQRAIIVVPDGLFEQWWRELHDRFGVCFDVFTHWHLPHTEKTNLFLPLPYVFLPMRFAARSEQTLENLKGAHWDLAIIDQADLLTTKTSNWIGDAPYTQKLQLARIISETSDNLLLLTATPKAHGHREYRTLLSLLNQDHFDKTPQDTHPNTDGYMRSLRKEDLRTNNGKPLFPEHQFHTVTYSLSARHQRLYQQILNHVQKELEIKNRMDFPIDQAIDGTCGYYWTQLIRNVTSSPNTIQAKLENAVTFITPDFYDYEAPDRDPELPHNSEDHNEEASLAHQCFCNSPYGIATAATKPKETYEITYLISKQILDLAREVGGEKQDQKWQALQSILDDHMRTQKPENEPTKIIIYTNFYSTADYLEQKLCAYFGNDESVEKVKTSEIKNQTYKEYNPKQISHVFDNFIKNPNVLVLLLDHSTYVEPTLHNVHLLVNYDLPWNLRQLQARNRWIRRIGQQRKCHIWNFVATSTIEEDVFIEIFNKLNSVEPEYHEKLLYALGAPEAFNGYSLDNLLMYAIQFADSAKVKQQIHSIIQASMDKHLAQIKQRP